MLPQTTLSLRSAALGLRLPPIAYPVSSKSPSTSFDPSFHTRHASTVASAPPPNHTPVAARPSSPTSHASSFVPVRSTKLDWDSFLRLRKVRRRYNLVSSIFGSMIGTSAGIGYLANKEIDPTQMIMGMDPLIMFGLATLSCGAVGWLAGPVLGSSAFGVMNKRHMGQIAEREKEFLQHIKKNRVDPSFQSFSNPVPDYYGEKIGSVRQYRQWLKDQRAYNRKSKNFL